MGSRLRRVFSPRTIALLVVALIVFLVLYYALVARFTPFSTDAVIQTNVVQVSSQVNGPITAVAVKDNAFVEKDTLLFRIDDTPYRHRVAELTAALVTARNEVAQLENEQQAAESSVEIAKSDLANAQWHMDEVTRLQKSGAASLEQLRDVEDKVVDARHTLTRAEALRDKVDNQLAAMVDGEHARVRQVEASLDIAKYNLEQTSVYAPTDGYVTNLQLSPGFYVRAGEPALTFVDTTAWRIVANFRENSLLRIEQDSPAEVSIGLFPGRIFRTEVESVGWGVDAGQGRPSGNLPRVDAPSYWVRFSQRFPVRLNPPELTPGERLRIGGSITVVVYTSDSVILNGLAKFWLRIGSLLNYLY